MPHRHRTESRTSPRRLASLEKQRQALALRIRGATFQQIAVAVGYKTRQGAFVAVSAAIRKSMRPPEIAHERFIDLERIDIALFHVLQELVGGVTDVVPKLVQLLRRRAEMLGLDLKQPVPGSSKDQPLYVQQVGVVDLTAATDAELDEIIAKAEAIREAGRIATGGQSGGG